MSRAVVGSRQGGSLHQQQAQLMRLHHVTKHRIAYPTGTTHALLAPSIASPHPCHPLNPAIPLLLIAPVKAVVAPIRVSPAPDPRGRGPLGSRAGDAVTLVSLVLL